MRHLALLVTLLGLAWGQEFYRGYCASCHLPDGQGIPGLYPPLKPIGNYLCMSEARRYFTRVVLYGLVGPIRVDGIVYRGTRYMPPFGSFLDLDTITLVLNDLLVVLKLPYSPFTEKEVARYALPKSTPNQMFLERRRLLELFPHQPCG